MRIDLDRMVALDDGSLRSRRHRRHLHGPARCTMSGVRRTGKVRMESGRPMRMRVRRARAAPRWAGLLTLTMAAACAFADASDLRIAAWNLEHLNDEHGEGCVERSEADYDAIARQIEAVGADVVAFQEVENEAAAHRVFDPGKWNVVMSSRPGTGAGPTCYDRAEGRLQHQATGIAIRRSVAYRRGTDLSALAGGNAYRRWGTHVVVGRGERTLHVLSVHLKSGCWGASQDEQGREACTVLRSQMSALRNWMDERKRRGERFVIAGDFNRRLAIPGDWAWRALSPDSSPLELATAGTSSHCDSRFRTSSTTSCSEAPRGRSHGPDRSARKHAKGRTRTTARSPSQSRTDRPARPEPGWRSRRGLRRSRVRAQTRLREASSSASPADRTRSQHRVLRRWFRGDGGTDLSDLLSTGAFQLSPSSGTGEGGGRCGARRGRLDAGERS